MTDKELLELAAKAIEINIRTDSFGRIYSVTSDENGEIHGDWNPLTDDGDRYRLAQKLGFVVDFELHTVGVDIQGEPHLFQFGGLLDEAHAFVLAAAEIGKALG